MDKEWIILMETAKKMGIPVEDVKRFIKYSNAQEQLSDKHTTQTKENYINI